MAKRPGRSKTIPSTGKVEIIVYLNGLDQEAYEENEIHSSGINPISVLYRC